MFILKYGTVFKAPGSSRKIMLNTDIILGEVLLMKVPTAETVVNKLNTIDNTYRNFQMEVLAGRDDTVTTTKEHGNTFKMDFAKVYWNPRLGSSCFTVVLTLQAPISSPF